MTNIIPSDLDRKRFKKLIRLTLIMMLFIVIIGVVGGYLVLDANRGRRIPYLVVLAPTIVASVVLMLPVFIVRRKWFPNKELLQAAAGLDKK